MSVAARNAWVPSSTIAHVLAALTRRQRLWPIIRQVGEVGLRHRLRTAMRISCARVGRRREKNIANIFNIAFPRLMAHSEASLVIRKNKNRRQLTSFPLKARKVTVILRPGVVSCRSEESRECYCLCRRAIERPQLRAQRAAPVLVITTLDRRTFDLAKLRGKVVLVNYWATWCAPCRKEMPKLDAFYKRYHDRGLEIIGISIDFDRDFDKARRMAHGVSYPQRSRNQSAMMGSASRRECR